MVIFFASVGLLFLGYFIYGGYNRTAFRRRPRPEKPPNPWKTGST